MTNASKAHGTRWVWTFNIYPFWDLPGKRAAECADFLERAASFKGEGQVPLTAVSFRKKIKMVTGNDDDTFWVAETGWSSPAPGGFHSACGPKAVSPAAFSAYYTNFMAWDLQVDGMKGPSHVFYFSMHDASTFGNPESFGLIQKCGETHCKLQIGNHTPNGSSFEALVV